MFFIARAPSRFHNSHLSPSTRQSRDAAGLMLARASERNGMSGESAGGTGGRRGRERGREEERILARQPRVSGRCTPMLACQREFDAPRHPLTSFCPTRDPGLSPRAPTRMQLEWESYRSEFSSFEKWIGPLSLGSFASPWNCFLLTYPEFTRKTDSHSRDLCPTALSALNGNPLKCKGPSRGIIRLEYVIIVHRATDLILIYVII